MTDDVYLDGEVSWVYRHIHSRTLTQTGDH